MKGDKQMRKHYSCILTNSIYETSQRRVNVYANNKKEAKALAKLQATKNEKVTHIDDVEAVLKRR